MQQHTNSSTASSSRPSSSRQSSWHPFSVRISPPSSSSSRPSSTHPSSSYRSTTQASSTSRAPSRPQPVWPSAALNHLYRPKTSSSKMPSSKVSATHKKIAKISESELTSVSQVSDVRPAGKVFEHTTISQLKRDDSAFGSLRAVGEPKELTKAKNVIGGPSSRATSLKASGALAPESNVSSASEATEHISPRVKERSRPRGPRPPRSTTTSATNSSNTRSSHPSSNLSTLSHPSHLLPQDLGRAYSRIPVGVFAHLPKESKKAKPKKPKEEIRYSYDKERNVLIREGMYNGKVRPKRNDWGREGPDLWREIKRAGFWQRAVGLVLW